MDRSCVSRWRIYGHGSNHVVMCIRQETIKIVFSICILNCSPLAEAQSIPIGEPVPIVEYRFNETGIFAPSTGIDQTMLTLRNFGYLPSDLHSREGDGVSGRPGDRAFNNSDSTRMGTGGDGGVADSPSVGSIGGLKSVTFQGWLKCELEQLTHAPRIIETGIDLGLNGLADGRLVFYANGVSATGSGFGEVGEWFFFAVTFDGTTNANNVLFYKGSTTSNVTRVSSSPGNPSSVASATPHLKIGNSDTGGLNKRPFDGWIDNIRIFGSRTDTSGVLSQNQLERLRIKDVLNLSNDVRLSVSRNNDDISIRWPAELDGFSLEYTSSLTSPTTWQPVDLVPTVFENYKIVNWPATATHFFRLRRVIP